MAGRWASGIPADRVRSCPIRALRMQLSRKRYATHEDFFAAVADEMAEWQIRQDLRGSRGAFGFVRNIAPKFLDACRSRGLRIVVDQMIAPALEESRQAALQSSRWRGWEEDLPANHELVAARERATWERADRITCASEYVRTGLMAAGVAPERIVVSPYPIDAARFAFVERRGRTGPLRVGCVGHVSLRKGAPWFLEVALRVPESVATFEWVGPVLLRDDAAARMRERVRLTGAIPRSEVAKRLAEFDVLFFPTTCEGSSVALLEAMASGLPILTTPNSGTVVEDGVEGFVCGYDETERFVDRVRMLASDASMRLEMGRRARVRVERETEDAFGDRLLAAFGASRT